MPRYLILCGVSLLISAAGCMYELRDEITEFNIGCSNHWAAQAAWRDARCAFEGICCRHSFKEGFMAGYIAVANGSNGCVPAVPDIPCCNHMWMDWRCSEGEKMEAWYDGYEHGAIAAKAEGMADANRIITRIPQPSMIQYAPASADDAMPQERTSPNDSIPPEPITAPRPANPVDSSGGPQAQRAIDDILR